MTDQLDQERADEIEQALAEGRKIEAIKLHRVATGVGLKEAKEAIDALIPRLVAKDPEKFARFAGGNGGGCASVLVLGAGLIAAATGFFRWLA